MANCENRDTALMQFRSQDWTLKLVLVVCPARKHEEEEKYHLQWWTRPGSIYICFNQNKGKRNGLLVDPIKSRWFNTVAFRQAAMHLTAPE